MEENMKRILVVDDEQDLCEILKFNLETEEERQEKKIGKIYYPAAGLSTETIPYYTSAYDMDMRKVIDVYAAASIQCYKWQYEKSFPENDR